MFTGITATPTDPTDPPESPASADRPTRTLTSTKIIVLIVAVLTPLSCTLALVPLGLAFGGPSTTLMYVVIAAILGLFCVGYAEMVKRITRPGAFYNYIARGLGRPMGVGGAMVAMVAYVTAAIATFATVAMVVSSLLPSLGVTLDWPWIFAVQVVCVGLTVWRHIDFNAQVLLIAVALELLVLAALVVGIITHKGAGSFPVDVIKPNVLGTGHWTVAFIFAILCFQGFESGALYSPEAIRPEKTVPRALWGTLLVIAVTFFIVTWVLTSVTGVANQMTVVQQQGPSYFIFNVVGEYLGSVGTKIFSVIVIAGAFASSLAGTNFQARYLNSLAKEDLLPRVFARENKHGAPAGAAAFLLGTVSLLALVCLLTGADPYTQLGSLCFGMSAVGITLLQLLASAAVVGYFLRQPATERHPWRTFVAPSLASLLLVAALVIEINGFTWLTGSEASWTMVLPVLVGVSLLGGVIFGFWLRRRRPLTYADLSAGETPEAAAELRRRRLAARVAPAAERA
ncbi:APC family permease [Streptomyces fulvoviolaceus]|uniref:APC family permease n=1 Tax=Streptomyces fulvoviolaceus TaxID=285535 RepID=UPI0004C555D5|nr:APC family permease [Streptomyces fulvoviolaceus]